MEGKGECGCSFFQRAKPYIAMISLQFGYAGMNIITKVSLNRGMSHYVLVVYRHAFATAVIAPFALILERKIRPKMSLMMFLQIFVLGLLGPVIDQNFYYAGLKFTSPTFSCAMSNMLPAMTFVMAVICRMEKVDIKKVRCQAKVLGTIVTVAGAMLMTLYKGHVVNLLWSNHINSTTNSSISETSGATNSDKDWFKGSILLIFATFAWASFFILQNITMRKYTAPLSLTALVCFMGTLQSIAVTFVMEHKPSVWTIGFDMNLLAAAYAGIVSSSIAYYVQGLVMEKRGPVFVTAFSPLMMIIVAIMGSFILAEKIYIGGILGAVLIVAGLYSVLWGKYKEYKEKEIEESIIPEAVKGVIKGNNQVMILANNEAINDIEMQKTDANKIQTPVVAIGIPMPQPPMLAREEPKA
ncbi:WAT1-related protein At5g07050-like [Nicotiana tabacum]|uniref:WAT1-related protein At5g07050-like n=2 Tax=Nicotiana tabacum TaxID=4097 RepID=A0AC58U3H7_TOBAC|nr:WAT1-related protein At5g07050-like [Nicotiana tomentosiformis]XP_016448935.1 PREDICTED: WAT1-related protein At5g07050-like [Nicotiana tabacum]